MGIDPDTALIVFAGRIAEAKGVSDLLGALDRIRSAVPRVRCAFVGPVDFGRGEFEVPLRADAPDSLAFVVPGVVQREVATWLGTTTTSAAPRRN